MLHSHITSTNSIECSTPAPQLTSPSHCYLSLDIDFFFFSSRRRHTRYWRDWSSDVCSSDLVVDTIARALGIKGEDSGQPPLETLKQGLRHREMLLMVDNFEQVVEAAPVVAELLAVAPGLKVFVTSRTPLRLSGEQEFPVPPLSLPGTASGADHESLSQYEAVRLFIERARAAKPDFAVDNRNAPAVAEICHLLEGLPLAIELAAARVRLLTPQAILSRLDASLDLLTGGPRDLPTRQQTLRNTIDWSYGLLDGNEQRLLARLGVFVGGATLEAIEIGRASCRERV